MNDVFGLVAMFALVLMNGFFVAAEFALVSVRRTRIDQLAEEGNATARLTQKALQNLDLYIAATQLGITMASLAIGFVAEPAIEHLIEPLFGEGQFSEREIKTISFGTAFAISTVLHIVIGELAPKTWALQRSEQVSLLVTRPLRVFTLLFRWAIVALNAMGNWVVRLFGMRGVAGHHTAYSEEEIRMIVSASSQEGVLEDSEKELVYNVFDLSDTTVREIMTPRVDMVVTDSALPLRRLLELRADHGYSRVPVYQDTADNIVGIVHTSDVLSHLDALDTTTLADIMRPVFFVPESMKINDLLAKMREKKSHLSIVVDEFGGTSGLVTLEDALEEIVGEIYDETDEEELSRIEVLGEGIYLMDASLTVHEVEERINSDIEDGEGEFDTLSGFMTSHFGDIPEIGQNFVHNGWSFTVEDADQRRVNRVRVERAPDTDPLTLPETSVHE
ncbi:hemolysin family protein [Deinococcus deserti]|uniref:Putative CBS domain-containing protein putative membrane protein n=1 Tax=Deinococcus deserti (strain DSM 17065 / CIP 109153 / LMG 22923 / VCD115) TaxID=546414 RepID=C1CV87_DEIDV|nr:hemolysin family protein [Deinococcus deserti]ACO46104.1 putative CBS domain-containing protein; putative membrane protein [Deinococcus deserti VCD115]